ncbi:hypothetical protein HJG53_01355 [Sphingomonas sp. ID1715]|uniref:hypothetical protein n=1 Tax=Sphingomonas sp. ID1715 TaxID=1656898 RepID=UPI001487B39B|nr:hypothetical protein [Sphingomonas sp. ID1715]NNM75553.1 hypothetical protein [Sphingomonas sp. ID1715]
MAQRWWRTERGRKRLAEIGDIVLGVLIALALGAVATWIGWQIDVADARDSLGDELGEIAGQGRFRERTYPCAERRLDQVATILADAEKTGRLPPVGPIGEPVYLSWSRGVWDSAIASDTASHFGREELDNLSGVYEFVDIIRTRTQSELDAWTRLYAIVGPGRPIGASEIAELRAALSAARQANRQIAIAAARANQTIAAFDLPLSRDTVEEYAQVDPARYCSAIAPADGRPYGQAPQDGALDRVLANPITRERIGVPTR